MFVARLETVFLYTLILVVVQSKKTSEIEVFQKLAMFFSNSVQIMSCFGRPINVQSNGGVNASSVLLVSQQD